MHFNICKKMHLKIRDLMKTHQVKCFRVKNLSRIDETGLLPVNTNVKNQFLYIDRSV